MMWRHFLPSVMAILVNTVISLSVSGGEERDCENFGNSYRSVLYGRACFDISGQLHNDVIINDPDDQTSFGSDVQSASRLRIDSKLLKRTEIGTLGAFIRLQLEFDPEISSDLVAGIERRNYAAGLEAFEIQLDNDLGSFRVGKIENAAAAFISNGFTDRGAESLNARAGLGVSFQRRIKGVDVRVSLSNPRDTTNAQPISPNIGIGFAKNREKWRFSLGATAVNVDTIIANGPLVREVALGRPFTLDDQASFGYGLGANVLYQGEQIRMFGGLTYTLDASNDVIFSFSDGFDAVTFYGGIRYLVSERVQFNGDISYVTAVEKGFRDNNGFEAAVNVVWGFRENWAVLAEAGFDSVDQFGAGNGSFFQLDNPGRFDFLFRVSRDF